MSKTPWWAEYHTEPYELRAAKQFLREVYEASKELPGADVYKLQESMKPSMHMNEKAHDIFFDLLEEQTYTCPLSGNTRFYGDAIIE